MSDEADLGSEQEQKDNEARIKAARDAAAAIPVGYSGDCARCGEPSLRLVRSAGALQGICPRCRDRYKL